MAVVMAVVFPMVTPTVAATLNLTFVIVATILGFQRWGVLAAVYTVLLTWVADTLFWNIGFPLVDTYIVGGGFNLLIAIAFGSVLAAKHRNAVRDGLTGLLDQSNTMELLGREVERAYRYGRPLTFLMIDLDDFKGFNDRHGHQEGDRLLRASAEAIRATVRQADFVGRYGGDEFAVILPETRASEALRLARRIHEALGNVRSVVEGLAETTVTVSIGGSELTRGKSGANLVDEADRALYQVKGQGKDGVALESEGIQFEFFDR